MQKKFIYLIVAIMLLAACKEKMVYQVHVDLDHLQEQTLYAVFESADFKLVDTLVYDGKSVLSINQPVSGFRSITIYYDAQTKWITAYLEPYTKVTVTGDARYPQLAEIKGGEINDFLSQFKKRAAPLLKEQTDLMHHNNADEGPVKAGTTSRLVNIGNELRIQAEAFIRKHNDKEASAVLIKEYFSDPDEPLQTIELLSVLSSRLTDFYLVKELSAFSEKARKTIPGTSAPDFSIQDIYGKTYNANFFGNSHYILAFVASWETIYHTEDVFPDKLIETIPADSIQIIVICLDEDPEKIRKALSKESFRWNVVTDSAGQAVEMMDTYNVASTPLYYLIDKSGKIVIKTDNGIELKQKLDELIPEK